MRHGAWVYIMASKRSGTLYCGVTNDLAGRAWAHKQGTGSKFCKKYKIHLLVWNEHYDFIAAAIRRETNIKKWPRKWKLDLIESMNPEWEDLYPSLQSDSYAR